MKAALKTKAFKKLGRLKQDRSSQKKLEDS